MIVLDTHVWVWWVHGDPHLPPEYRAILESQETLGVSIISCWEVAKLAQYGRLTLPCPVSEWLDQALSYPRVTLLELTPAIAAESTMLPGAFNRDPADQIIVATARLLDCPIITTDQKILAYPHVKHIIKDR
ncbi:MAG: type II toxin-antitoxin system VapC family toxin [Verrucomicrobia bacterium]|nr:type II toxin-antitoxin system VapC family toxin [Verrucomicrobiota bacterium]